MSIFGCNALLSSDVALFSKFLIDSIDSGDFLGRERHKFRRHTTGDHPVRVIIENQLAVVPLQSDIVDVGRYPQNLVWIGFSSAHMARFDVVELRASEPKALSDVC